MLSSGKMHSMEMSFGSFMNALPLDVIPTGQVKKTGSFLAVSKYYDKIGINHINR